MDDRERGGAAADLAPETVGGGRGRLAIVLLLAVVAAVVMGFVGLALGQRFTPTVPGGALAVPAETVGWRVYHDPLGLFTMRLPPGWTADSSLGAFSEGGPGYSDSGQNEQITFRNPALGAASPRISVFAQPIHTGGRQMECAAGLRGTSTFNGYLADETLPAVILFDTQSAHFQIDETIPGVLEPINPGGPPNPPPPPTPPPAATATAERALIQAALTTFQPADPHPLTCG